MLFGSFLIFDTNHAKTINKLYAMLELFFAFTSVYSQIKYGKTEISMTSLLGTAYIIVH